MKVSCEGLSSPSAVFIGHINLIANYAPSSPVAYFAGEQGPSACGMGWRVCDAAKAYAAVIERGAQRHVGGVSYFFLRAFRRAVCTLRAAATIGLAQLGVWVIRVSRSGSMIFSPRMRNTRIVCGSPSADSALLSNT